jgi:hypothetical protein
LPAVRPGLVGVDSVDAAEHLVPSCSVHHDHAVLLPCRGWDLTEEEVDFSLRSLLVVVSFAVVAAGVAVVAVAVIAVLWGGIAWFACGGGVLWGVCVCVGGGVDGSRAADWVEDVERAAGGVAAAVRVVVPCSRGPAPLPW